MTDTRPEPAGDGRPENQSRLNHDQLNRLADLVAREGLDPPQGLDPDQERALRDLIRRRLRERLTRFLARAVALRIRREAEDNTEDRVRARDRL